MNSSLPDTDSINSNHIPGQFSNNDIDSQNDINRNNASNHDKQNLTHQSSSQPNLNENIIFNQPLLDSSKNMKQENQILNNTEPNENILNSLSEKDDKRLSHSDLPSHNSEELDLLRPLINPNKKNNIKKRKFSYSNPNNEMLDRLKVKREQGFFNRNFSALKGGSLRAVVIFWIRMTTGIGIMALPFYMKQLGIVVGSLVVLLAGILSYFSFKYIFSAQYFTGKKDMVEITKKFLPGWIVSVYSYTLIIDVLSSMQIYIIVSWNLFTYFIYIFGFANPDWIKNPETLEFKDYNTQVILIRVIFLHVVFFITIPFLLKRDLESMKIISFLFMLALLFVILILFAQTPLFYKEYHQNPDPTKNTTYELIYKPFWNLKFFGYLFSIILAFYVQPFVMTLRKELLVPSMTRLKKVARLSVGIELILFISLGSLCYFIFGDKYTTNLIILRKPLKGYTIFEWIFRGGLILFFLFNTIGIPFFNVSLRNMIAHKYWEFKKEKPVIEEKYLNEKILTDYGKIIYYI